MIGTLVRKIAHAIFTLFFYPNLAMTLKNFIVLILSIYILYKYSIHFQIQWWIIKLFLNMTHWTRIEREKQQVSQSISCAWIYFMDTWCSFNRRFITTNLRVELERTWVRVRSSTFLGCSNSFNSGLELRSKVRDVRSSEMPKFGCSKFGLFGFVPF